MSLNTKLDLGPKVDRNWSGLLDIPFQAEIAKIPDQWQAKLPFEIKQAAYTIKTADCIEEFQQVLQLRREVFLAEFSRDDLSDENDFDELDLEADFLIIKEADQVIASYRLIHSDFSDNFYSCSEFNIEEFLTTGDKKLELSRACVAKNKRAGIVLHLLWRGLADYMMRSGARYLFGCSSLQSLDLAHLVQTYSYLKDAGAIGQEYQISPLADFNIIDMGGILNSPQNDSRPLDSKLLPPLLLGYIKAGAKIYGAPALDLKFSCLDLFTILNFDRLSRTHLRKYISAGV